jgi:LCP family protein required for cell wall assembly
MDDFDDNIFRQKPRDDAGEPVTIYKSRRHVRRTPKRTTDRDPKRGSKLKRVDPKTGRTKGRRRWPWIVGACVLVLLLLVIGLGLWFYISLKAKEPRMKVAGMDTVLKPVNGGPDTTLIMGVDRGSVPGEEGPGRSDVMMLVTVAPDGNYGGIISIPRDSRVKIAGYKGYNKINAAHAFGGPKLAIQTVEDVTGLNVNHFVELDFNGFKDIVNAVGGVHLYIPHAIHDKYAGDVPAGDVVLNGDQALALVRARYDVKAVPNGDLDREKNQRAFIDAFLSSVAHQRNPFTILKIADVVSKNAKTDLSFYKMFTLGSKLQSLKNGRLARAQVPGAPKTMGGVWYFIINYPQLEKLVAQFTANAPHPVTTETSPEPSATADPAQFSVKVLNGSRTAGLARKVSKELAGKGYKKITTGDSRTPYTKTTVYYAPGQDAAGKKVASDVGDSPDLKLSEDITTTLYEADVVVVIGSDHS